MIIDNEDNSSNSLNENAQTRISLSNYSNPYSFASAEELDCYIRFLNYNSTERNDTCLSVYDEIVCWPPTTGGSMAVLPCFDQFNSVKYDTTKNATRFCHVNGTWANKADYFDCKPLDTEDNYIVTVFWDVKDARTIYFVGYILSLVALLVALWIFISFKDLRCLRNTIHTNLLITYVLIDITWIITGTLQLNETSHKVACIMIIFLTYLLVTNFFWMLVEGLYLYILVVKTFSIELVKFYVYALIGWGLPAIFVTTWALVKAYYAHSNRDDILMNNSCTWQSKDHYDYIFQCPIILVLIINIFFLCQIMWVLITKLRAATSVESKQYWKAAKALLVLIPLLGITYVVVIVTPTENTAKAVFTYLQAALLSTQGLTVAILYCFLNGEVRNSIRHHIERWKNQRGIGKAPRHSLTYRTSLQGECVRLYNNRSGYRERGSCMSFSTTTTCIGGSCHQCSVSSQHRQSNGSYGPVPIKDELL